MIVVSVRPILYVYPFIQRYFVKSVMIGSIKLSSFAGGGPVGFARKEQPCTCCRAMRDRSRRAKRCHA
jgi:hypothetical protein